MTPPARAVPTPRSGQRDRRRCELPAPGTAQTRRRDALIVSLLAYARLRPGELREHRLAAGQPPRRGAAAQLLYVARALGHSVAVLVSTSAHLTDEYEDAAGIDADGEIAAGRRHAGAPWGRPGDEPAAHGLWGRSGANGGRRAAGSDGAKAQDK